MSSRSGNLASQFRIECALHQRKNVFIVTKTGSLRLWNVKRRQAPKPFLDCRLGCVADEPADFGAVSFSKRVD